MGRWLNRVQANGNGNATAMTDEKKLKSVGQLPHKTYKNSSVGSVGKAQGAFTEKKATAAEVETMLANLRAGGVDLREIEGQARFALRKLTRVDAAEALAVMDDLFNTARTRGMARAQCRRVLSDPQVLAAAKAVWPDLATLANLDITRQRTMTGDSDGHAGTQTVIP